MQTEDTDAVHRVKTDQIAWARRNGIAINRPESGLASLDLALFCPLTPQASAEIGAAPGGELRRMHSFRSSTALAVNVFMPWYRDPTAIAHALGGTGRYKSVAFERPFATGVSRDPHLDVLLEGGDVPIAVESKFVEPYDDEERSRISEVYISDDSVWQGMPQLRIFARQIADRDVVFERLDASQLIKHSLGLAKTYGSAKFSLLYVWYRVPGAKADQHAEEVARFVGLVRDAVDFTALTYQELFSELLSEDEPMPGYFDYLGERYFRAIEP